MARFTDFQLPVEPGELRDLAERFMHYGNNRKTEEAAFESGRRIRELCDYSRENLKPIVDWKSGRRWDLFSYNTADEIKEALHLAVHAREPRTAMALLTGLCGVGLPMASSIMTVLDEARYTIVDYRVMNALGAPDYSQDLNVYVKCYLPYCLEVKQQLGISLRALDRALWMWDVEREEKLKHC